MTEPAELQSLPSDVQAALDAGTALAEPQPLGDEGRFFSVITPAGAVHRVIDLEEHLDEFRDRPRRKAGTVTVHTASTLVAYLAKHGLPETELWADVTSSRIVAVVNAHQPSRNENDLVLDEGDAGWSDHRAQLTLHKTPAWVAWLARDGKLSGQVEFAEHLEDRAVDIVTPTAADMLEIAQSFTANRRVAFDSSQRLSSGQVQLRYHEEIDAKAGPRGELAIPEKFEVALQPYEGSPFYKLQARLRYRITDGTLRIGYALERPDDVLRNAFTDVVDTVAKDADRHVWQGLPTG